MTRQRSFTVAVLLLLLASQSTAAERWNIGLTSTDERIAATVVAGPTPAASTVLLLGGLQGKDDSTEIITREAAEFETISQARRPFRLIAVPLANPEGQA